MADQQEARRAPAGAARATRREIELGHIAGIQLAIDYSWVIIFLLVLWSLTAGYFPYRTPGYGWGAYLLVGLVATLLFFASVLTHELAHALVGNRLGHEVKRITLFLFGGMAHLSGEPRSAKAELAIAAVGPLTSFALGAAFWLVSAGLGALGADALWTAMFRYLAFINVALAVFNLLPGYPLDGGRLLRAYLWQRSGNLRAASSRAANWGGGIAVGLMVLGALQIFGGALIGGLWLIFIGMFLRGAARASYQGVVMQQALAQARVADVMVRDPVLLPPDTTVQDAIEEYFLRYGYGGFPVGEEDVVAGVLSLAMVQRCPPAERAARTVREIMRPLDATLTVTPDTPVADALQAMANGDTGRLLVLDHTRLAGLITRAGILRFVQLKEQLDAPR